MWKRVRCWLAGHIIPASWDGEVRWQRCRGELFDAHEQAELERDAQTFSM